MASPILEKISPTFSPITERPFSLSTILEMASENLLAPPESSPPPPPFPPKRDPSFSRPFSTHSPKVLILSLMASKNALIPPPSTSISRILETKLPTPAAPVSAPSEKPKMIPARLEKTLNTPLMISTPILSTEKKPSKMLLTFSIVASDITSLAVNSFKLVVRLINRSAVIGGKTSRNASLIGLRTLCKAAKEFIRAPISSLRPPNAFQPVKSWLRASVDLSMNPVR